MADLIFYKTLKIRINTQEVWLHFLNSDWHLNHPWALAHSVTAPVGSRNKQLPFLFFSLHNAFPTPSLKINTRVRSVLLIQLPTNVLGLFFWCLVSSHLLTLCSFAHSGLSALLCHWKFMDKPRLFKGKKNHKSHLFSEM